MPCSMGSGWLMSALRSLPGSSISPTFWSAGCQLSAGQKTRVGLAKAMINELQVLFLDEPTASLDPDTADWVRARLD